MSKPKPTEETDETQGTSHTPGPWGYTYDGSSTWSIGPSDDPQVNSVATIFDRRDARARANAQVIAAAPDLLAALKRAREALKATEDITGTWDLYQHSPEMQAINAALAKAEGH